MKNKIEKCFGESDKVFAGHPVETDNAIELLKECIDNSISIDSLLEMIEKYLSENNCSREHIDKQMKRVVSKFEAWL